MNLPKGMAYGNWEFPLPKLHDLTLEIEIRGNVERRPGRYLQLYDGDIAGIGSYFGLQTDVAKPGYGGQGHGLLFTRWKTRDSSNARVAPNGWIENSGHEDDFVGVRPVKKQQMVYAAEGKLDTEENLEIFTSVCRR